MKEQFITFSYEGREYYGVLHLAEMEISPLIIMIHGFCGDRIDTRRIFVRYARQLVNEGFYVLRVDLIGSGLSEGIFSDVVLSKEVEQVKVILEDQLINKISSSIGLIGFSEGAKVVLKVKDYYEKVKCVALWSPLLCEEPEVANRMPFKVRFYRHSKTKQLVLPSDFGLWVSVDFAKDYKDFNVDSELEDRHRNVEMLAIFGEKDILTMNSQIKVKELDIDSRVIAGADHLFTSVKYDEKLRSITLDWFKKKMMRG